MDNTPPAVTGLAAEPGAASAHIHFDASDPGSSIARAQYSLDAGDWILVLPVGQLSDAPQEKFDWTLDGLAPGEHTVAVRVSDEYENETSAKVTFRIGPAKSR